MNVSSVVVTTRPEYLDDVIEGINTVDLCEVHFSDENGRIVATIEGESIDEQMERMKAIQAIPNVFSANLSFSYSEEELATGLDRIKNDIGKVPRKLE
jgi:nitrate reductase NapD